jgi:hypothetical protein
MKVSLLGVALLALSSTIGFAQTAPAAKTTVPSQAMQARSNAAPMHRRININKRRKLQQKRIANGIATGRISARKGARLERREASIGRQERKMRAAGNGKLTRANKVKLTRKLNRTSRAIYRAKHNSVRKQALLKQ